MLARLVGRIQGFSSGGIFLALTLFALVSVMSGCAGLTSSNAKPQTPTPTPTPSPTPTPGVALDQYGGRKDIICAQTTGSFHPNKIGHPWLLCTPAGNSLFLPESA